MTIVAKFEDPGHQLITPGTILKHTCTIPVPSSFTVVYAVAFKQNFQQTCTDNPDLTSVVLDFDQTTFMDSSGIGALVGCYKVAQKRDIRLSLRNVSTQVIAILSLAGLESLFEIEPQMETIAIAEATPSERPFTTHPSVRSRMKRGLDIAGALVGLGITAAVLPVIVLAIKLDSPGPILFGQTRCSWMGKRFKMWKFRSMVTDAEARKHLVENQASGALFKNDNDPRITRVGRFLRRTSLDELPQFWNVLVGEMSLVGTRPPTPDEVEQYEIPQWNRLDIKPGMTGEWQVSGRSKITDFDEVVRLDMRYQENWSLTYDLQIIIKTIMVLFRKNAGAC
jgi:exopolysaccharide biosynthesis polyprenyl glycosylphosphotransferase